MSLIRIKKPNYFPDSIPTFELAYLTVQSFLTSFYSFQSLITLPSPQKQLCKSELKGLLMVCVVEIRMNYINHFQQGFLYLKNPLLIKLRLGTAYVARPLHTVNIYFLLFFPAFFASNCLHGQQREKGSIQTFLCCRSERLHHRNTFLFPKRSAYFYKKLIDIMFCSAEKAPRCHWSRGESGDFISI